MPARAINVRLLGGIDPGLASGGFVVIDRADRRRVLAAVSMVEPSGAVKRAKASAQDIARLHNPAESWSDIDYLSADIRARAWVARLLGELDAVEAQHGPVDAFAVESFVDQAQHAKKMMRNRWHTPLVTGYLCAELQARGAVSSNGRVVFQNAGIVLRQFSEERSRLAERRTHDRDLIVPGDRQVTNEHQSSALAHALALDLRLPSYRTALAA